MTRTTIDNENSGETMQTNKKINNKKLIIAIVGIVVAIVVAIAVVVILVDKRGNGDAESTTKEPVSLVGDSPSAGVVDGSGIIAARYGDITITQEEYSYGYMSLYNQVLSVVKQYDEYYPGYGAQYYDVTLSPADQNCPASSLPEGVVTWGDYFIHYAAERAALIKTLYLKAMSEESKDLGFEITAEQQTELDNNIATFISALETKAEKEGISVDEYISKTYGYSLSKSVYEEQLRREYISELYLSWYSQYLSENISQEDLDTYYLQNREDIDIASVRVYVFSYASSSQDGTPTYSKDEAKSKADQFISKVSDEQSFIDVGVQFAPEALKETYANKSATLVPNYSKSDISTISAEMAEWMFDDNRGLYDKVVIDMPERQAYFAIMMTVLPHKDTTCASADVRHLLVQYGDDKTASREEAEALLEEWRANGATEEAFIELVKVHTDDVASAEAGGLYEGINSSSSYVPEFLEWAIAPHKYGDTGIVETTYGYHIMFYVGGDSTPSWESYIRTALAQVEYSNFYDDLYSDISAKIVKEKDVVDKVNVENLQMIVRYQGLLNEE